LCQNTLIILASKQSSFVEMSRTSLPVLLTTY